MGLIPINPSDIALAQPFVTPLSAYGSHLSERPIDPASGKPQHGLKFVPMQLLFDTTPVWSIDLSALTPTAPVTQISSMFVNATQSEHDVVIYFPDSGWQDVVSAGGTAMLNPITTKSKPAFYVILDSSNQTSTTDIVNIMALDTFVPPVKGNAGTFQKVVTYGYGEMFELQPNFTQSQAFTAQLITGGAIGTYTASLIPNKQWYITGINITYASASNTTAYALVELLDNGVTILQYFAAVSNSSSTGTTNAASLSDTGGVNFISSGNGHLTLRVTIPNNFEIFNLACNIYGGVLIT